MARLRSIGFEVNSAVNPSSGGASGWEWDTITTGSAPSITTTNPRSGTYAGNISSLSSGSAKYFAALFATSTLNVTFTRVYVRFDTFPSAENRFALLNDANATTTPVVYLTIDNSGVLRLYDEDGQITGTTTLSTAVYYRIEIKIDASAAAGSHVVEAKVDGSTAFASSSARNLSSGVEALLVGGNLNAEANTTGNWTFDDIAINDNSGSFQNGYPGSGKLIYLRPSSAGDSNTWFKTDRTTAGSSTNYTLVNENPPDDTTTFIASSTLNHNDDYNLDDSGIGAGDTVNVVAGNARVANSTGTTAMGWKLGIAKTSGGTYSESSEQGTAFGYLSGFFLTNKENSAGLTTNPLLTLYQDPDGSNWTQTTLDSMHIRAKITTDSTTRFIEITNIWVVVDYTPAGASNYSQSPADTVTMSDAAAKAITKPFSDTITLSDSIVKAITSPKADTITLSDAISRAIGLSKADTITLSDAMVKALAKLPTDVITISDMTALVATYVRSAADTLALTDSASTSSQQPQNYTRSVSDVLTLADHVSIDFSGRTNWYERNGNNWYLQNTDNWYQRN